MSPAGAAGSRTWSASPSDPRRFWIAGTIGHWEGDLLVGRYGRSHLATLVERHSRYLLVLPLPDARSSSVIAAFAHLPEGMARSLTWDRGIEMTRHQEFSAASGVPVYFCDAYCPWQLCD